jgi:hypothetical protein
VSRGGPVVYINVRDTVALVRGPEAYAVASKVADPIYSKSGRGWCIPATAVDDALAYCESSRLLAVVSDERRVA